MTTPQPARSSTLPKAPRTASASQSGLSSPRSSRDPSPAGPAAPSAVAPTSNPSRGMRSRKNSHEVSPQRQPNLPTSPSAAVIQRALSNAAIPPLQPTSDHSSRLPRSQRTNGSGDPSKDTPSWPVSPRLKSPPPSSTARRSSSANRRKPADSGEPPAILVHHASPDQTPEASRDAESNPPKSLKASNISTLATVEESTPTAQASSEEVQSSGRSAESSGRTSDDDKPDQTYQGADPSKVNGKDADDQKLSDSSAKSAAETALRGMTVTTETVTSIPQASIAPAERSGGKSEATGTLRTKKSNDTIRPKKERKKSSKKPASVNAASSSTRADVFEDRVKNAMEEATSDDSDETFVYESNPPETQSRPSRHHSRTPSGASLASMTERGIMRSIAKALEQRPIPKIRSMKFASNNSNYGTADEDGEAHNGTVRARDRTGSSMQHHHMGRQNRNGTGPSSLLDEENPLFPLSKTRSLTAVGGRASQAARMAAQQLRNSSVRRGNGYSSLDMDTDVADDERTPLVGTVRTPRSTRNQRPGRYRYSELRHPSRPRKSVMTSIMGCLIILLTVSILSFGVVCFLFAMCKPLTDLTVVNITNVIASEQELMLDLVVEAVNPNLVPVTIADMDVNLFAKSKYVGSEKWWRDHPPVDSAAPDRVAARRLRHSGVKAGSVKIAIPSPPEADPPVAKDPTAGQTLLLGHVAAFDNPLTFDGSFWERRAHRSTGSLRLSKPGNRTELGGTERWERVLKHDFELLVRGVLLYSKPLGGWTVKVPVNGGTVVDGSGDGEDDDDDDLWIIASVSG